MKLRRKLRKSKLTINVCWKHLKNQKKLEDEFKTLQKDKDSYIKEIEKAKALIAQREADIAKNEQDQATKTQQIDIQKQIVETVKQKKLAVQ